MKNTNESRRYHDHAVQILYKVIQKHKRLDNLTFDNSCPAYTEYTIFKSPYFSGNSFQKRADLHLPDRYNKYADVVDSPWIPSDGISMTYNDVKNIYDPLEIKPYGIIGKPDIVCFKNQTGVATYEILTGNTVKELSQKKFYENKICPIFMVKAAWVHANEKALLNGDLDTTDHALLLDANNQRLNEDFVQSWLDKPIDAPATQTNKKNRKIVAMSLRLDEDLWAAVKSLSIEKRTSMHALAVDQLRKLITDSAS